MITMVFQTLCIFFVLGTGAIVAVSVPNIRSILIHIVNFYHVKYTSQDVLIKSFNYKDSCIEILYINKRRDAAALVLITDEPLKKALMNMVYITDYSPQMVQVPMPVMVTDGPGYSWIDTGNFMRMNLDDSMSMNLLLNYLNNIAMQEG